MLERMDSLGVYLIAGCGGSRLWRRCANPIALHLLLRLSIATLRKNLQYWDTIHVITEAPLLVKGIQGVKTVSPRRYPDVSLQSRWGCMTYKWDIEEFAEQFEYLLYLDADTLVMNSSFLEEFRAGLGNVRLIRTPYVSKYTAALLSAELHEEYRFDTCFMIGKTSELQQIFGRCRELLNSETEVFRTLSDMPLFNRALADLHYEPESLAMRQGITWAQSTSDFSKSVYHFNSGSLFRKVPRMARFLSAWYRSR